jgi:hypothetical protein
LLGCTANRARSFAAAASNGAGSGSVRGMTETRRAATVLYGTSVPGSDPRDPRRRLGACAGLGRSARQGNAGPSGGPSAARRPARGARGGGLRGVLGARDNLGNAHTPREGAGVVQTPRWRGRGAHGAAARATRRDVALRRRKNFTMPLFEMILLHFFV